MYYTLPCYCTSVIEGFCAFFFYSDIWGNIIPYLFLYIYGRVVSQWQLLLDPKEYCTIHILLNYLTVLMIFEWWNSVICKVFPGSKTIKMVRYFRSICIVQYYLWSKKVTTGIQPSGTWSFLEFYDFKCSLLLQVMGF